MSFVLILLFWKNLPLSYPHPYCCKHPEGVKSTKQPSGAFISRDQLWTPFPAWSSIHRRYTTASMYDTGSIKKGAELLLIHPSSLQRSLSFIECLVLFVIFVKGWGGDCDVIWHSFSPHTLKEHLLLIGKKTRYSLNGSRCNWPLNSVCRGEAVWAELGRLGPVAELPP